MRLADVRQTLSHTPAAFRALLAPLTAEALAFREAPETWNPFDVLCHITDGEITDWRPRVEAIMAERGDHRFTSYNREGGFRRYNGWPAARLIDEFDRLRRDNLAYLDGLHLDDASLARTGIHPEFGSVRLDQLLACWAVHDLAHIAQISRVVMRYNAPAIGPWTKYFSLLS